jgi:hypothetical protein
MIRRLRTSICGLLLLILACALVAVFVKPLLYPNRLAGRRFAVIGLIDLDSDGRDDRVRLKRMIERNGGLVDYDLPPTGPAAGDFSPSLSGYIIDGRNRPIPGSAEALAIARARDDGVPPLPLDRVLARMEGR